MTKAFAAGKKVAFIDHIRALPRKHSQLCKNLFITEECAVFGSQAVRGKFIQALVQAGDTNESLIEKCKSIKEDGICKPCENLQRAARKR